MTDYKLDMPIGKILVFSKTIFAYDNQCDIAFVVEKMTKKTITFRLGAIDKKTIIIDTEKIYRKRVFSRQDDIFVKSCWKDDDNDGLADLFFQLGGQKCWRNVRADYTIL